LIVYFTRGQRCLRMFIKLLSCLRWSGTADSIIGSVARRLGC
jgi:hypothetical protein